MLHIPRPTMSRRAHPSTLHVVSIIVGPPSRSDKEPGTFTASPVPSILLEKSCHLGCPVRLTPTSKENAMTNIKAWALDVAVRAIKTAAQTAVALLVGNTTGILTVNWTNIGALRSEERRVGKECRS